MLQMCQYVELSLAHVLVRGRGACSAPRCGVSNNKPLQKQHLRRKGGPVPAPGKAAEPKHSSQAAPAPPVSLPAMPGCAGEVACPDSWPALPQGRQRTHGPCVPSNSHHRPLVSADPSCPVSAMQETDTYTQGARGTLTFTLNICCYSPSASIMKKRKRVN